MFRLEDKIGLALFKLGQNGRKNAALNFIAFFLLALAAGSALFTPAQPAISQTREVLLPCPRPIETNSWGVRIGQIQDRPIQQQNYLVSALVAEVPGLATSRRCTWQLSNNSRTTTVAGWQVEVSTEQNANKLVKAAARMGFTAEVTRK